MGLQFALAKTRIRKKSKWKTKADEDTLVDGWQKKTTATKNSSNLALLLLGDFGLPFVDPCV